MFEFSDEYLYFLDLLINESTHPSSFKGQNDFAPSKAKAGHHLDVRASTDHYSSTFKQLTDEHGCKNFYNCNVFSGLFFKMRL